MNASDACKLSKNAALERVKAEIQRVASAGHTHLSVSTLESLYRNITDATYCDFSNDNVKNWLSENGYSLLISRHEYIEKQMVETFCSYKIVEVPREFFVAKVSWCCDEPT